ncbi:MAG TPA: C45 family peptidase [Polyangia bacterium]|jgi:hypothetical protein
MSGLTRRELLKTGSALAVALGSGALGACGHGTARGSAPETPRELAATADTFPLLEVRGTPYAIGHAIGRRFGAEIRAALAGRAEALRELTAFVDAQPPALHATFVAAAQRHTPAVVEELRGWADGSGVPLRDLFILNLAPEYGALQAQGRSRATCERTPGCSTIVRWDRGRALVAHNEDGDRAYAAGMFLLRVHPEGKPSFLCASYPGVLPGNAPWVNDRGVLMTTNFIPGREVKVGVGRYFLDRLAMEATSLDAALAIARHPERGYAFHHVIAEVARRRAVALEATPSKASVRELAGLYLHTNHLVHPPLADEPQDLATPSSTRRLETLERWRAGVDVAALDAAGLAVPLTSHDGRPYSPCRHPAGEIRGATLLTAIFDVDRRILRIAKGQPCAGRWHDYAFFGRGTLGGSL